MPVPEPAWAANNSLFEVLNSERPHCANYVLVGSIAIHRFVKAQRASVALMPVLCLVIKICRRHVCASAGA